MFSRTNVSFVIPELSFKVNKIDFVGSAINLGTVFNDGLSWTRHISVIVYRIYSMPQNLWAIINATIGSAI